jgi:HEAT repeat protein
LAVALHQLGERSVALSLFDELKPLLGRHDLLKHEVPMALQRLGEEADAVACYSLVAQDSDVEAFKRADAAAALGEIDTAESISVLRGLVTEAQTPSLVLLSAASALCRLGLVDDGVPVLLELADGMDPDPFIALRAAEALLSLSARDRAIDVVAAIALDGLLAGNVRTTAVRTLGEVGGSAAAAAIRTLVNDPDGMVRAQVASTLARMGSVSEAVPLMLELIAGSDIDVYWRRGLVDDLGELEDARASAVLARVAHDPTESGLIRLAAAAALVKSSDGAVGADLIVEIGMDEDPDFIVRLLAAERLGELGGDEVVDTLDRMAHDSDSSVREAVITSLERAGGPSAISSLSRVALDQAGSPLDRLHAARILMDTDPAVAVAALVSVTQDTSSPVTIRLTALELLGSHAERDA